MFTFTLKDKSVISGGIYFVYSEQVDDVLNLTSVNQDDNLMNNSHIHDYNKQQIIDFNANTRYRKVFKKSRIGITLGGIIQLKDKNLDGWRLDSISRNIREMEEIKHILGKEVYLSHWLKSFGQPN